MTSRRLIPTLPHDQVVGFDEIVPVTPRQILAKRFQPYLATLTGCVPHPGVDAQGRISAGLPTTSVDEGGLSSPGQCYSRSLALPGHRVIVYAWYFPKDCPSPGRGHRHDWEGAVVWLGEEEDSAQLLSFCYSQHGRLFPVTPSETTTHDGRPMLGYSRYGETVTHSMWLHDRPGELHPLIDWEDLPEEARIALNDGDYGAGTPLMRDGAFEENVYRSWTGDPARIMDLLGWTS